MTATDQPRPLPPPAILLVTMLVALAIGVGLGIVARGDNVLEIDLDLTTAIQQVQGDAVRLIADIANVLGSTAGASVAIAIAIVIAAARHARWEVGFLITLLVLRLAGTQMKPLFDSPRPTEDLVTLIDTWDGTGYPSGHALTASTMALGLAVIAWRRILSRRQAIAAIAALLSLMLAIGWARVWSGAHWASDVIGGYAFGVAIVALSALAVQWAARKTDMIP